MDKGWLPARQCYAGQDWEGPESFDDFFKDIPDRGVLLTPEEWPVKVDLETWKGPLRYLGVSWEPKIRHFPEDQEEISLGHGDLPNPWKSSRTWNYWKDYSEFVKKELKIKPASTLNEQWAIEFFPECLPVPAIERPPAAAPADAP